MYLATALTKMLQLPWYSVPDQPFPPRHSRLRRRRDTQRSSVPVVLPELPSRSLDTNVDEEATVVAAQSETDTLRQPEEQLESQSAIVAVSEQETPITSEAPSEADSTHPTTPSSVAPQQATPTAPRQSTHARTATKTAVPIIPLRPIIPAIPHAKTSAPSASSIADKNGSAEQSLPSEVVNAETTKSTPDGVSLEAPTSPAAKAPPKSWAELLRQNKPAVPVSVQAPGITATNGATTTKATTLGDVIRSYGVESDSKIAFIEPRGLVNTGNMCYMNSVSDGTAQNERMIVTDTVLDSASSRILCSFLRLSGPSRPAISTELQDSAC